jgi:hypothetical protein
VRGFVAVVPTGLLVLMPERSGVIHQRRSTLYGQIQAIQDFYIEVASLNRGLDQADKRRSEPKELELELELEVQRNRIKAQNVLNRCEDAKRATASISTWPWAS